MFVLILSISFYVQYQGKHSLEAIELLSDEKYQYRWSEKIRNGCMEDEHKKECKEDKHKKECKEEDQRDKKRKQLIEIKRCLPVQQRCDDIPRTIFKSATSHSFVKSPSGTISIKNTCTDCMMTIKIKRDEKEHFSVVVGPNSSFTTIVSNLEKIDISCSGNSNSECFGLLEMNLFFVVQI